MYTFYLFFETGYLMFCSKNTACQGFKRKIKPHDLKLVQYKCVALNNLNYMTNSRLVTYCLNCRCAFTAKLKHQVDNISMMRRLHVFSKDRPCIFQRNVECPCLERKVRVYKLGFFRHSSIEVKRSKLYANL